MSSLVGEVLPLPLSSLKPNLPPTHPPPPPVVSITVRVLMKACSHTGCGFFGSGGFIIFEIAEGQDNYEVYELLPMLLLGVVGGLLGSAFITLNTRLTRWRKMHLAVHGIKGKLLEALVISLITSLISFGAPRLFECQVGRGRRGGGQGEGAEGRERGERVPGVARREGVGGHASAVWLPEPALPPTPTSNLPLLHPLHLLPL